jgi:molybdopterin-synthase adenylyltransferase
MPELKHGFKLEKPRLPAHYYLRFEPPNTGSPDESLIITSERRTIVLKGHSFREFLDRVVPLLDGSHLMDDIRLRVSDVFAPEDLDAALELLAANNVLEEGSAGSSRPAREHQWNFFHELGLDASKAQQQLAAATVAVFGLGPLGAAAATSLGAAGVGNIRCVDHLPVAPADPMLNPIFQPSDVGHVRAEVIARRLAAQNDEVRATTHTAFPDSDDAVREIVDGADFVVGCADRALSTLSYRLNRACLKARIRWTSGSVSAFEGVVGPTITPGETACYLCYQMRAVACTENPEEQFAHLRFLDRRKQDDSARRENLVFGAGIVGNLLGLEAFRALTGISSGVAGRVLIYNLIDMGCQKHVVLRKPWCPACF